MDQMIRDCRFDRVFGFEPGMHFYGGLAIKTQQQE